MNSNNRYYKYRSLANWQFLLDIFLNKRLYAAPFASLNDPMEGQSYYGRVEFVEMSEPPSQPDVSNGISAH